MPILHKNITAETDIHNPKWFSNANNGDYAWKNEQGNLESIDELLLPAALNFVDGSVAPPTSNVGDIYVLSSGGSVNAGWGSVSLQDWVRYDGAAWNAITPQKSSLCYNENSDTLLSFNGLAWAAIGGGIDNVTSAQKAALSPNPGDFVYDTDLNSLQRYDGSTWIDIARGYGVAAAYNSNGIPTFYTSVKAAYDSGVGNIKLFGDYEETSSNPINIVDGRNIDLNGFTYTYNVADSTSIFEDNTANNSIRITNGRLIRKNGTGGDHIINCNLIQTKMDFINVYAENENGACLNVRTTFNGSGSEFVSNIASGSGFYFNTGSNVRFGKYVNKSNGGSVFLGSELKFVEFICEGSGGNTINGNVYNSRFIGNTGRAVLTGSNTKIYDSYLESPSNNALDLRNSSEVYNSTMVSDAAVCVNTVGTTATKMVGCIVQGSHSVYSVNALSRVEDCVIVNSGAGQAINVNASNVEIVNNVIRLESGTADGIYINSTRLNTLVSNNDIFVNDATAVGIGSPNIDAYIVDNDVKGTATAFDLGTGSNLWTGTKDSQGNSAQV